MSRATLATAKAELVALLDNDGTPTVDGVNVVFDYLPFREKITEPVSLAVYTEAVSAEFFQIAVALFLLLSDDEKTAQDLLDSLLPAIDVATDNGGFGPTNWQITYPESKTNQQHYIAICVYQVGREDVGAL